MQRFMKTLVYINKNMKTSVFYFAGILVMGLSLLSCDPKPTSDSRCNMAPDAGMCMAAIPRYYYNNTTHQCEQFIWGGCGEFPFETLVECETACE